MITGLMREDRDRPGTVESREGSGGTYQCIKIPEEGARRTKPGSFQWSPVPGPEAMATN